MKRHGRTQRLLREHFESAEKAVWPARGVDGVIHEHLGTPASRVPLCRL